MNRQKWNKSSLANDQYEVIYEIDIPSKNTKLALPTHSVSESHKTDASSKKMTDVNQLLSVASCFLHI